MLVYRVEHAAKGHGPYMGERCAFANDVNVAEGWYGDHPAMLGDWPNPNKPGWGDPGYNAWEAEMRVYFCACPNLSALRHWMGAAWERLQDAGYTIRVFDCPDDDAVIGNCGHQVFFKRGARGVRIVSELPLFTLTLSNL